MKTRTYSQQINKEKETRKKQRKQNTPSTVTGLFTKIPQH